MNWPRDATCQSFSAAGEELRALLLNMAAPVTPVETGTLRATSDESQFIGSSNGMFFVNSVQCAFNISRDLDSSTL
jgi:hypothetical protein